MSISTNLDVLDDEEDEVEEKVLKLCLTRLSISKRLDSVLQRMANAEITESNLGKLGNSTDLLAIVIRCDRNAVVNQDVACSLDKPRSIINANITVGERERPFLQ